MDKTPLRQRVRILDVPIDPVHKVQAHQRIRRALCEKEFLQIVTPNSEIVVKAAEDPGLSSILERAGLVVPDGIGLVLAGKIQKTPLPERVTGVELMDSLLKIAEQDGYSVFFLGAREEINTLAVKKARLRHPRLRVAGHHHGYYPGVHTGQEGSAQEQAVARQIQDSGADILLVALGSPGQEYFIDRYAKQSGVSVAIGVGGAFDVLSGQTKRAPRIWQRMGLEWAYRLAKEPARISRMGALPRFVWRVVRGARPVRR